MNKIKKTDHFYLVDGSGYIFRAYYASSINTKKDGLPTGAKWILQYAFKP